MYLNFLKCTINTDKISQVKKANKQKTLKKRKVNTELKANISAWRSMIWDVILVYFLNLIKIDDVRIFLR